MMQLPKSCSFQAKREFVLEQQMRFRYLVFGWVFSARIVVFPSMGKEIEAGNAMTLLVQPMWKEPADSDR